MVMKTAQSLVSVICQAIFIFEKSNLDDPLMMTQAKILFGMSIALSAAQLIIGLMMLLVKWSVLRKVDVEEAQDQQSTTAASLELGDMYKAPAGGEDGDVPRWSFHNPIHSNAIEMVKKKDEEIRAKDEEIDTKDEEIRAKDDEIAKVRSETVEEIRAKDEEIGKLRSETVELRQQLQLEEGNSTDFDNE